MGLGQYGSVDLIPRRNETVPGRGRYFSVGRGITSPLPGCSTAPYWVTTEAEVRRAVQELAAKKVDIVKIWVDDRLGMYKKLSPELYTAVIDEAHKNGLRVIAHVYTEEDAKGLLRAGIDRNSLKVGTEIVVRGYQSKDKACTPICKANGRDVTFPDGRKLFMGSSGTGAPKDGSDKPEMP